LSLWKRANGKLAVMMWIAFLNWCAFLSWNFWAQLYYQDYIGYSPIRTVVRLLPMFVTGVICNVIVAIIVGRVPVVFLITIGTGCTGLAGLLFAIIRPSAPYWEFGFPAAVLSVIGADFVFASGSIFIAKVALPHEQSLAGGIFQTMTQLGTAVGVTVTTIVFDRVGEMDMRKNMGMRFPPRDDNSLSANGTSFADPSQLMGQPPPPPPQNMLGGYQAAQWTSFGFGMLAVLLAIVFLRGVGVVGHHDAKAGEVNGKEEQVGVVAEGDGDRDPVQVVDRSDPEA